MKPSAMKVLQHLQEGNEITPLVSIQRLEICALSQRIGELRRAGYDIKDLWLKSKSGGRYKTYYMDAQVSK
jgi:hypothetical protein